MSKDESNSSVANSQSPLVNDGSVDNDGTGDLKHGDQSIDELSNKNDSAIRSDLKCEAEDVAITNGDLNNANIADDKELTSNVPPVETSAVSEQNNIEENSNGKADVNETETQSANKISDTTTGPAVNEPEGDRVRTDNIPEKQDISPRTLDAESDQHKTESKNELPKLVDDSKTEHTSRPSSGKSIRSVTSEKSITSKQSVKSGKSVKSEKSLKSEKSVKSSKRVNSASSSKSKDKITTEKSDENKEANKESEANSTPTAVENGDANEENTPKELQTGETTVTEEDSNKPEEDKTSSSQNDKVCDKDNDKTELDATVENKIEQEKQSSSINDTGTTDDSQGNKEIAIVEDTQNESKKLDSIELENAKDDTKDDPSHANDIETEVNDNKGKEREGSESNTNESSQDKIAKDVEQESVAEKDKPSSDNTGDKQDPIVSESTPLVEGETKTSTDQAGKDPSIVESGAVDPDVKTDNSDSASADKNKTDDQVEPEYEPGLTKVIISEEGVPQISVTSEPTPPPSETNSVVDETEVGTNGKVKSSEESPTTNGETEGEEIPEEINEKKIRTEPKDPPKPSEVDERKAEPVNEEDIKTLQNEEGTVDSSKTTVAVTPNKNMDTDDSTEENKAKNMDESKPADQTTNEESNKKVDGERNISPEASDVNATNDENAVGDKQADSKPTEDKDGKGAKSKNGNMNEEKEQSNETKSKEENKPTEVVKSREKTKSPEPVKTISPLDLLLEKNVEIDGNVFMLTEMESKIVTLLTSMKSVMKHYSEILALQSLKDFTLNLGKFRGDFQTINEAFKRWTQMSLNINKHLKDLKFATDDAKAQMTRKFQQEDLGTWIDTPPEKEKEKEKLQEQVIAEEKQAMAKVAEARHAVSVAATGVAEAHQFVAEMEKQAAEAEAMSKKAAANAEVALVAAEEAKLAAEERRRAEEAAKKRAEERARIKAAEEEKKKAEEEIKIHMEAAKKGTNVEDERKSFMAEKERKEAERKNPKNWPKYSFNAKSADFKPATGCVIRAIDGSMRKTDVTCQNLNQSAGAISLADTEELVSNIVLVKQTDEENKLMFDEPVSVALPISLSRIPTGKEVVVKQQMADNKWRELPSSDVHFDEYKELKFVDGRTKTFGTFAVVLRPKKDQLQLTKRGNKAACSFDTRLSVTSKPGTFKGNTTVILESSTVDMNAIPDLKVRHPKECEDLLTSSPFVNFRLPAGTRLEKPLTFTVPLPQVQTKQKRPQTGVTRETKEPQARPQTARHASIKEEEPTDEIHLLYKDDKTGWTVKRKVTLTQPKNKDIATFDLDIPFGRFILLRTKLGKRDLALEKMVTLLEQASGQRNVKVILRQSNYDVCNVRVVCVATNKVEKTLKKLEDAGFTEGPAPSANLVLREGQEIHLRFRGNIHCVSPKPNLSLTFNSNIPAEREFKIDEKDTYAQKMLQSYRGFIQVFTKAKVPKAQPEDAPKNTPTEMIEAELMLCELLIELPKSEATPPRPLVTAPLIMREGPLTNGVLRLLAGQLGKEWKDLAGQLNLKPMRIQAILRQHVNKDTPATRYEMLLAWAKRVPRSVDKVQILHNALVACGRLDLADDVKQRGQRFNQQRFMGARVSHLRQAFVKVAKAKVVFDRWKTFAKNLGMSEDQIEEIDAKGGSGQEKCYSSLEQWKDHAGEEATVTVLAQRLRDVKQESLSRDVESVVC